MSQEQYNKDVFASVTGSNLKLKHVNADISTDIAAGGLVTATITPPSGVLWRTPLIWFWGLAPSGATTGTHRVQVYQGMNSYQYLIIRAVSTYTSYVRIMSNIAETANESALPTMEDVQQQAIQNLVISQDLPLFITYQNDTDAINTGNIEIRLIVLEEAITP